MAITKDPMHGTKMAIIGHCFAGTDMTAVPLAHAGWGKAEITIVTGTIANTGDVTVLIQTSDATGGDYTTLISQVVAVGDDIVIESRFLIDLEGQPGFLRAEATINAGSGATGNHTVVVTARLANPVSSALGDSYTTYPTPAA